MRDINKSYKNIDWLRWHHRKNYIRINCAIMCAILLIILLLMFPVVSDAQGSGEVITVSGIEDKPFYIPTNYCMGGSGYSDWRASKLDSNSTWSNNAVYGSSIALDCTQYFTGSGLSFPNDDYKYYVITTDGTYVWTNFVRSNYQCFWYNNRVQVAHSPEYEAEKYCYWYTGTISNPNSNNSVSQNNDINGSGIYCLATNMMVISAKSGINLSQMQTSFGSLLESGDIVNVNWNYLPNYDPFATEYGQPVNNYPSESADNNLVLSQADYIFTHQNYYAPYSSEINTGSPYPIGTITFKGQPNDYQLEHSGEFTVRLRFHFDYNVDYQNWNTSEFGYFKRTSQVLGNKKNLKIGFGDASYDIPMSTFIQNKNSADLVIKDIFDNLMSNGNSLSGLLAQSKEVTTISYNDFLITCYANIVSDNGVSGAYIENYNFNSRKGLTTSKDIEDNNNPYTPNPSSQADDDPDSTNITPKPYVPGPGGSDDDGGGGSSSTTTTNGNGSIVINNNPTFNNNSSPSASASATSDGSGNTVSRLIDGLFGGGNVQNGQIGTHTQNQLITNTGANNWLGLFSTTMGFMPSTFWAEISLFVGIVLGILVVGFILRVILDFL